MWGIRAIRRVTFFDTKTLTSSPSCSVAQATSEPNVFTNTGMQYCRLICWTMREARSSVPSTMKGGS